MTYLMTQNINLQLNNLAIRKAMSIQLDYLKNHFALHVYDCTISAKVSKLMYR